MRLALLLPVLAFIVACGSSGNSDDVDEDGGPDADLSEVPRCEPRSGDRLRLKKIESGNAAVTVGIYDEQLGGSCAIATINGVARCVPDVVATGSVFYNDPGCINRMFLPSPPLPDPPPPFFRESVPNPDLCGSTLRFSPRTSSQNYAGTETIYSLASGSCVATTAQQTFYHLLGAPLEPEDFVALEPTALDDELRINVKPYEGEDGSRICSGAPIGDRDLDIGCSFAVAEDGVARCLPSSAAATNVYADSGCSVPTQIVRHNNSCGATTPSYVARSDAGFCFARTRVRSTGTPFGAPTYTGTPGMCNLVTIGTGEVALAVGPSVSPFTFAEGTRTRIDVGGRLFETDTVIAFGPRVPSAVLFDPDLDALCTFQKMTDGALHCVPFSSWEQPLAGLLTGLYVDPACSAAGAVSVAILPAVCSGEEPKFAVYGEPTGVRLFNVVDPFTGPLYRFAGEPAACVAYDPAGQPLFTLGTEILPGALAVGTAVTE